MQIALTVILFNNNPSLANPTNIIHHHQHHSPSYPSSFPSFPFSLTLLFLHSPFPSFAFPVIFGSYGVDPTLPTASPVYVAAARTAGFTAGAIVLAVLWVVLLPTSSTGQVVAAFHTALQKLTALQVVLCVCVCVCVKGSDWE